MEKEGWWGWGMGMVVDFWSMSDDGMCGCVRGIVITYLERDYEENAEMDGNLGRNRKVVTRCA
jgi:hypothetical protein